LSRRNAIEPPNQTVDQIHFASLHSDFDLMLDADSQFFPDAIRPVKIFRAKNSTLKSLPILPIKRPSRSNEMRGRDDTEIPDATIMPLSAEHIWS
jgi:hypothetical protein